MIAEMSPCQQERQERFPHAPSLAPLHTEVVRFSYQKRTDPLRLREVWNQGCSQARHIFYPQSYYMVRWQAKPDVEKEMLLSLSFL